MTSLARVLAAVAAGMWLMSAVALPAQTTGIYDDFAPELIDPLKWRGAHEMAMKDFDKPPDTGEWLDSRQTPVNLINTESRREIVDVDDGPGIDRRLRLQLQTRSGSAGSRSRLGEVRNLLRINDAALRDGVPVINILRASVTVRSALPEQCGFADAGFNSAVATLRGSFFNNGTSTGPGDLTGDVIAGINIRQASRRGRTIWAFISRCDTPACVFTSEFASTKLGTWTPNVATVATIRWDPANNRFLFRASGFPGQSLAYSQDDTHAPRVLVKELGVITGVWECGVNVAIDALFDNVEINAAALPAGPAVSAPVEADGGE